jgi:hypothetical protein
LHRAILREKIRSEINFGFLDLLLFLCASVVKYGTFTGSGI